MGGVAVIKEGWAQVKENKNFIQPWKQKFLVLRKEALDFHKQEGSKVAYTLFLKDVINVKHIDLLNEAMCSDAEMLVSDPKQEYNHNFKCEIPFESPLPPL